MRGLKKLHGLPFVRVAIADRGYHLAVVFPAHPRAETLPGPATVPEPVPDPVPEPTPPPEPEPGPVRIPEPTPPQIPEPTPQ